MDLILIIKAAIMGVVEGVTEFVPISSTGHLIIAGEFLDFLTPDKRGVFEIFIQMGAILAIVWEYREKILKLFTNFEDKESKALFINIFVAFIPIVILGLSFGKIIKSYLFSPINVAIAFIIGGFVIIWAEKREHVVKFNSIEDLSIKEAIKLGIAQSFALIPGTSRSAATIIGGLFMGLSRKAATEFSFLLAMPTLTSAALYDLYKNRALLNVDMSVLLFIGSLFSFISALFAVRALLKYISNNNFTVFAIYRIIFGLFLAANFYK